MCISAYLQACVMRVFKKNWAGRTVPSVASASASNQSIDDGSKNGNTSLSHFQKTVCLHEWWLIKAEKDFEGKRLAVAGFTSREQQAVRVFSSAPILKRYDVFTLETIDGIYVIIKGFINKAHTEENGFPSEVFNHFVFGFPPYWEECAEKCLGGESTTEVVSRSQMSLDKLPMHSGSVRDSGEVTPKKSEKTINEERRDCDKMNLGVEDVEDMVLENGQDNLYPSGCNESSVEVPKVCSPQVVSENITGDSTKDPDAGCAKDGSDGADPKRDQNCGDSMIQSVVQRNTNEAVRTPIRLGVAEDKNNLKIAAGDKESIFKASTSKKITKRKLTYESPVTRKQKEKASIVTLESLSCKRSRSGRLLLPSLEFWRNQRAIYDVDRQITGIKEGLHVVQPSRGSRSEPQRKQREFK